jgi:S-formylglutathione hydrolase
MLITTSRHRAFDGEVGFYTHASVETKTDMKFAVFLPAQARTRPVPALYFLAGLTSTEETFITKSDAVRYAAEFGLALVAPDTSPRGCNLPGEDSSWDFGTGAGFYLDAEAEPWDRHYRMYSYVTEELPALVERSLPVDRGRRGIMGHSMGGHGALVAALRNPGAYRSVSAFSPIANPVGVPWGVNAFSKYLGPDRSRWEQWDASVLMRKANVFDDILIDQGAADQFLATQLHTATLLESAAASGQTLTLRMHEAYDHSYWFVQSFIRDHLAWHAARLNVAEHQT